MYLCQEDAAFLTFSLIGLPEIYIRARFGGIDKRETCYLNLLYYENVDLSDGICLL